MKQLDSHIAHLKRGKFTVWPLKKIVAAIKAGEPLPDKTVAITIDDAYASVMKRGLPKSESGRLYGDIICLDRAGGRCLARAI